MKVTKETNFILSEKELCAILLDHFKAQGKLPELTEEKEYNCSTNLYYKPTEDIYWFEAKTEQGVIDDE